MKKGSHNARIFFPFALRFLLSGACSPKPGICPPCVKKRSGTIDAMFLLKELQECSFIQNEKKAGCLENFPFGWEICVLRDFEVFFVSCTQRRI